jgi:hypothetical protein
MQVCAWIQGKNMPRYVYGIRTWIDGTSSELLDLLNHIKIFTLSLLFFVFFSEKTPCSSVVSPCRNGGTCIEAKNDFRCICTREWKGKDCSESKICDNIDLGPVVRTP